MNKTVNVRVKQHWGAVEKQWVLRILKVCVALVIQRAMHMASLHAQCFFTLRNKRHGLRKKGFGRKNICSDFL